MPPKSKSYGTALDGILGKASDGVVMIVLPGCPHCSAAMASLVDLGTPFVTVPMSALSQATLDAMAVELSHRTYPRIFVKGRFLGGNTDLQRLRRR